jgi:nitroreductase/NAD-dependent dihydropyrimidine dehydrogenase PreA subunit
MYLDLLTIDQKTCNQDGLCAAVCPVGLIEFKKGSFPGPIKEADELCIRCGHCVAVCPSGSLNHRDMDVAACPPLQKELRLSSSQCEQFLKSRRSIRTYKKKSVTKETLENLIDIARYAPSGHNSQGVEWLVIAQKKELHRLACIVADWMRFMLEKMPEFALGMHMDRTLDRWEQGVDVILRGAPALVIACGQQDDRTAPASCTIALTYLELAAIGLGLGCCWAGYFNAAASSYPQMKKALTLSDGHQSLGAMMVGYPKFEYQRLPQRKSPEITWRL